MLFISTVMGTVTHILMIARAWLPCNKVIEVGNVCVIRLTVMIKVKVFNIKKLMIDVFSTTRPIDNLNILVLFHKD